MDRSYDTPEDDDGPVSAGVRTRADGQPASAIPVSDRVSATSVPGPRAAHQYRHPVLVEPLGLSAPQTITAVRDFVSNEGVPLFFAPVSGPAPLPLIPALYGCVRDQGPSENPPPPRIALPVIEARMPAGLDAFLAQAAQPAFSRIAETVALIDPSDAAPPKGAAQPGERPVMDVTAMAMPGPAVAEPGLSIFEQSFAGAVEPARHEIEPAVQAATDWRGLAERGLRFAGLVAAAWAAIVVLLIVAFRFIDPPFSALMVQQRLSGEEVAQVWVPIGTVSPKLIRAVIVSEDGRFCQHLGVDFQEMQNAIARAGDGSPRGASTISMQVAKNMFLWPSKSYLRKTLEIPLTFLIEAVWTKRRIMEVYLNVAEWGPGIFGVEAASQFHFGKPASRLNEREAARLAVALPNPYQRDAGDPGPGTRRLAADIQTRIEDAQLAQTTCVTRGD